jgi:hypothetical protein
MSQGQDSTATAPSILSQGATAVEDAPPSSVSPAGGAPVDTESPAPASTETTPPAGDWRSQIPKEYAREKVWDGFKNKPLPDVLKSYVEAQKLIGSSVRLPGEKDAPEIREKKLAEVYTRLGKPESPEAYQLSAPKTLMPHVPWSDESTSWVAKTAHKLNLNPQQAQVLADEIGTALSKAPNPKAAAKDTEATLRQEWGDGVYTRNLTWAFRTLKDFGGDEAVQLMETTGLGNDPRVIKLFANIGKELAEANVIRKEIDGVNSSGDAQSEIKRILGDKNDPYHNAKHPLHEERVQAMLKLHELAYS